MIPDYYDPRKVGELFLEDPAWIAKAACPQTCAARPVGRSPSRLVPRHPIAAVPLGELGTAYLGTQGDVWDAQKDMALAGLGVLLAMTLLTLVNTWLRRDFAREWVEGIGVRDAPPPPAASIKLPGSLRRHNPL